MQGVTTVVLKIPEDLDSRINDARSREGKKKHFFILELLDERLTQKERNYRSQSAKPEIHS